MLRERAAGVAELACYNTAEWLGQPRAREARARSAGPGTLITFDEASMMSTATWRVRGRPCTAKVG